MTRNDLYVFKDPDGYFIGIKGTPIVKQLTRAQYQEYRILYQELEYNKGENENNENEKSNDNDTHSNKLSKWMQKASRRR